MKVGIITYHRAHNYGALLQAYALQTYIRSHGHKVEIIDYWPKYHEDVYKLIPYFNTRSSLGKVKEILLLLLGYFRIIKRRGVYKKFIKEQFGLYDYVKFSSPDEMCKLNYDIVVYGSDQIWRKSNYPNFKGFSDVFFGDYPSIVKKKMTYAASMGIIDINEKDKDYLQLKLKNFDAISVREQNLKCLVEDIGLLNVPVVLDPVFLLNQEDWCKIIDSDVVEHKEKYILFYQITTSKKAIRFVNQLAAHYKLKIIEIRGRVDPLLFRNRYMQTESPNSFISLIKNAEFVVSTSFHGVAFSILFEKQFYALGMGNNSERVESLLVALGIQKRHIKNEVITDFDEIIEYEKLNEKLNVLKLNSCNYLNREINDTIS